MALDPGGCRSCLFLILVLFVIVTIRSPEVHGRASGGKYAVKKVSNEVPGIDQEEGSPTLEIPPYESLRKKGSQGEDATNLQESTRLLEIPQALPKVNVSPEGSPEANPSPKASPNAKASLQASPLASQSSTALNSETRNSQESNEDGNGHQGEQGKDGSSDSLKEGPFPKPPRPTSKLNLIQNVSAARVKECERKSEEFNEKNGFFSKGHHACCLFGKESGFCGKKWKRGKVCNGVKFRPYRKRRRSASRNNRSEWTDDYPHGRCCITKKKGNPRKLIMTCIEDQTEKRKLCDQKCEKLDDRCGKDEKYCRCNFDGVWLYEPDYKRISKYLEAGMILLGNKCYVEDRKTTTVLTSLQCCGMRVPSRDWCVYTSLVC